MKKFKDELFKTKVSTVRCIQASRCKNTGKEIFTMICEYQRAVYALTKMGILSATAVFILVAIETLVPKEHHSVMLFVVGWYSGVIASHISSNKEE